MFERVEARDWGGAINWREASSRATRKVESDRVGWGWGGKGRRGEKVGRERERGVEGKRVGAVEKRQGKVGGEQLCRGRGSGCEMNSPGAAASPKQSNLRKRRERKERERKKTRKKEREREKERKRVREREKAKARESKRKRDNRNEVKKEKEEREKRQRQKGATEKVKKPHRAERITQVKRRGKSKTNKTCGSRKRHWLLNLKTL